MRRSTSPRSRREAYASRSERPAETEQHLKRVGDVVRAVAEVDAEVAEPDAPADAFQPRRGAWRRRPAVLITDPADVIKAHDFQAGAPAERVLEVQQRHRRAGHDLVLVAVDRADAAEREQALRRRRTAAPAADCARAEFLMRREELAEAAGQGVAREVEVAVERAGARDLRRPVDAPPGRVVVAFR